MFTINDKVLKVERFPDDTQKLNIDVDSEEVTVKWLYEKDEEMTLFFIVQHLREKCGAKKLVLNLPYVPNARMDRVKNKGEVFTLKYFCQFINSMQFEKVIVRDVHSNVSLALLNNVVAEPVDENINKLINTLLNKENDIVFYPDEGSCKRYSEIIKFPQAFGSKNRDWTTGEILGLDVQGQVPNETFNVLIVDDISSYGGTFYYAAKKLKELGANKIYLYITHCENSILKGDLIKSGLIEKVYTTRSIYTGEHELICFVEEL